MPDADKKVTLNHPGVPCAPRSLAQVAADLWGGETPSQLAAAGAKEISRPSFPPFEQLWAVADETVDWTDALANARCPDGLTSNTLWTFFHDHAAQVLAGDLDAYLLVLKAANPLGDLQPYARQMEAQADSADRLSASFEVLPAYFGKTEEEKARYLCGMALRMARDLFALLPVTEVAVRALLDGEPLLNVVFPRAELQRVRFSFVDPVQLVKELQTEKKEKGSPIKTP